MYYLSKSLRLDVVQMFLKSYVYEDAKMQENAISDVEGRLRRIFANKTFMRNLSKPANAWLNESADRVADQLILFVSTMK